MALHAVCLQNGHDIVRKIGWLLTMQTGTAGKRCEDRNQNGGHRGKSISHSTFLIEIYG
jgi:hypothetical protein